MPKPLERQALVEPLRNSNIIDINISYKKYYNCGNFGYIVQYYKNRKYSRREQKN